ncbi:MAG TPA: ABC transporter ATP-binding protein [Acidimicrobiales bacterium]|nr:ABC transporter ATP-binding protein [Acidimicrobiales bacterium]
MSESEVLPADAVRPDGPKADAPVLEVEDLTVTFATPDGPVKAVQHVSLSVDGEEILGIVGESGSGKSVTMMAVMGLLPKTATITGSVKFRGQEILGLPDKELRRHRGKHVAMIFQDPLTSLNPVFSVGYQISEAIRVHNDVSKKEAADRAVGLLDLVGIPHARQRADQYPHEFSGGMRQRAMIAMAIANDPDVLIADEPTTALDVTIQAQILEVLETAQAATRSAIVLITHDLGVVAGVADRVHVMYAGRAAETGAVDDVFIQPRHPYTLGLLDSLPRLDAEGHEKLTPITGAPPSLLHPPPGCPFHPRCRYVRPMCSEVVPELRFVGGLGQRSACHYAEELAGVEPGPS